MNTLFLYHVSKKHCKSFKISNLEISVKSNYIYIFFIVDKKKSFLKAFSLLETGFLSLDGKNTLLKGNNKKDKGDDNDKAKKYDVPEQTKTSTSDDGLILRPRLQCQELCRIEYLFMFFYIFIYIVAGIQTTLYSMDLYYNTRRRDTISLIAHTVCDRLSHFLISAHMQ